jgi:excisionase family DNA binding protein
MAMEKLVSIPEAAHLLGGVSVWTIRAWLSQGKLRRTKVGGRTMIRESELRRFIEDGNRLGRKVGTVGKEGDRDGRE